jgi:hypothetical protein
VEVPAKFKGVLLDPVPQVVIDGQVIRVVEPLRWYQWIWAGLPILLIFGGGAIGGALGFLATSVNTRIFRSEMDGFAQYGLVAITSFGAVVVYFILAGILIGIMR